MPQRNLLIIFIVSLVSLACHGRAPQNRYLRTLTHSMGLVHKLYVDDVEPQQLFDDAMQGMMGGLDQYSSFISSKSFRQFQESLDQEFGGIGIIVEGPPRTERMTVVSPIVNTPAYNAGLRAGDVIMTIDGVLTEGMRLDEAVKHMRGLRGSEVTLIVRREETDEPLNYRLRRDTIPIESVLGDTHKPDGSWNYVLEENPRIGYIRITSFGEHTARDLAAALETIPSVDGLIIDLRGNAGGLLTAAVATCDMLIDQGDIVSTRGRNGVVRQRFEATSDLRFPKSVPMAVLTNRGSASASEIVAACLKDHDRAIVVGERTWGKGTVQNIIELEGGRSAIKLTTSSYWRPNNQNIHRKADAKDEDEWGVRPSDGFKVALNDEEIRRVLLTRRNRDVVPGKEGDAANSTAPPAPTKNPVGQDAPPNETPDSETPDKDATNKDEPESGPAAAKPGSAESGSPPKTSANDNDPSDLSTPASADDASDLLEDEGPFDDPQLRKAIEYIEESWNPGTPPTAQA